MLPLRSAACSELRQGKVKGFCQELGIVCGDAHRGLDAEDVAMQSPLADQDSQLSQPLHDLQAGRTDTVLAFPSSLLSESTRPVRMMSKI